MKRLGNTVAGLTLVVAVTALAGCSGNTALIGRDSLPGRSSQEVRGEMMGTVERVDAGSNEIHLRPSAGHPGMVTYSTETRVTYLGRVYPVSQLQSGDIIAMQMEKDSRGNPHTHMIRLRESAGDWAQRRN